MWVLKKLFIEFYDWLIFGSILMAFKFGHQLFDILQFQISSLTAIKSHQIFKIFTWPFTKSVLNFNFKKPQK
jgi:hypothetical protein